VATSPDSNPPEQILTQIGEQPQGAAGDRQILSPPSSTQVAGQAVEDGPPALQAVTLLGIVKFISRHRTHIYDCLENSARSVSPESPPLVFFAESLPLVSSIIHVGSTRVSYELAKRWVTSGPLKSPAGSEASVLSALTFTYLVDEGYKHSRKRHSKLDRALWEQMHQLVDAVTAKARAC
jgi:hypothetical protein